MGNLRLTRFMGLTHKHDERTEEHALLAAIQTLDDHRRDPDSLRANGGRARRSRGRK